MKPNPHRRNGLIISSASVRAAVFRYGVTLLATIGIANVLPLTALGNSGGIIAFIVLVTCSWYSGIGPALLAPLVLVLSFRFRAHGFHDLFVFSTKDLFDIMVITIVMTSVGVSGALRRRSDAVARMRSIQLQDQDRRKDEFLATLAHELRNPLAPIRTGLEILRMISAKSNDAQKVNEVHRMMQRQIDQMVRLIDDLLDVGRINTGKIELRREVILLSDVVNDAAEASRPFIDSENHHLSITLPKEPIFVDVDRVRISQVLTNLLNNSAKFTKAGGRIWVEVNAPKDTVEIRIRDSGIGISPDFLPHVFELFAQAENILTRSHQGLGIGLNLVRTLVELHGGQVHALSDGSGKGSEFVVQLPRFHQSTVNSSAMPQNEGDLAGRRILIVDDNQDAAESLAMILSSSGHFCETAFGSRDAERIAVDFQPDVFLLDIGMPEISGFELMAKLRSNDDFKSSFFVAVTGWGQAADRQKCLDAGFNQHLVKPVNAADLQRVINSNRHV